MQQTDWTRSERIFRAWMLISAWMYGLGVLLFLVAGAHIPHIVNLISAKICSLPLYPLPSNQADAAFWRVLGVSMMAMITWIAAAAYRDPRANARLVPILLLSKFCSTALYFVLFCRHGYLAYIVGAVTDGPIFVATAALWCAAALETGGFRLSAIPVIPAKAKIQNTGNSAAPSEACPQISPFSRGEEAILAAAGQALMPQGGVYPLGYEDLQEPSLADARRMCAAVVPPFLFLIRTTLHILDAAPFVLTFRFRTFRRLAPEERARFLESIENSKFMLPRMIAMLVKMFVIVPLFNQPEAAESIGYRDPGRRPQPTLQTLPTLPTLQTPFRAKAVVIGTGAGGAVAAAMLAEAGIDTIIVEAGARYTPEEHGDVLGGLSRMYLNGAMTLTLGSPPIPVPLGQAVGGSTIINSSTCFRPPEDRIISWGGPSRAELEPFCAEVERRINAHAVGADLMGGNWRVMKRGCDALGIEIKPLVHNVRDCKGLGRCQYGCTEGAKQSMDRTFIPSALAAGARLLSEHRVESVIMENGKAVGVAGTAPGGPFEVRADTVVLAMGALTTPAFLLRAGLANASGRVGRGLHIHPAARVVAEFNETIDGFKGIPQGPFIDHWASRGIMIEGIFMPPGILMASLPGAGDAFKTLTAAYRRLAAFGVMVADTASGRVRPGRFGAPFLAYYQMNQADAESIRFGIARIAEIFFSAGARRVFTSVAPMPCLENQHDLASFETHAIRPKDFVEIFGFHPLGTCPMGAAPRRSVVDFNLQTHDVPGLYIMDGSVIPGSLGVNPQVTIMTLAMRAATTLAKKLNS